MRKLFLDDFRTVTMAQTYAHPRDRGFYNGEWDIVRSYDEFVRYIDRNGMPDMVSFDHDLADEHYAPTGISYDEFTEKTGYHCMQWMINYIIDNKIKKLPHVLVHSANPVGAENIERLWTNFIKQWDNVLPNRRKKEHF